MIISKPKHEIMKEESESPIHGPSSNENYLKSIFGSVSYCVVILRKIPHWSVRMTSCNFRLLTWKQQTKITSAASVRIKNKFQVIIMGHGDSLS